MKEKFLCLMASVHLEAVHEKTLQVQDYSIWITIKKYHMEEQDHSNDMEMDLLVLYSALLL